MGEQAKREIEAAGGLGVRTERRGAIAIWTIDRPDRMNALSRAAVRELGRLAREAAADPTLRVVVAPARALVQRLGPHVEDTEPVVIEKHGRPVVGHFD